MCVVAGVAHTHAQTSVVVTVPTQGLAEMQALTQHIDALATELTEHANHTRVLLGAIEATMSRVVDSDSLSVVTKPVAVPTMSLLEGVAFDTERRVWSMRYRTTQMDPRQDLNRFTRILYLSKDGNMQRGDPDNPCLEAGVVGTACLTLFEQRYFSPPVAALNGESILAGDRLKWTSSIVNVTVLTDDTSLVQTLLIEIPHAEMRRHLAREEVHQSALWGEQKQYVFGIGMLFLAAEAGKHVVISDVFSIIENSAQKLTVSALDAYSVATFAEFYSSVVAAHNFRTISITYVLQAGETLVDIDVAMRSARRGAVPPGPWARIDTHACSAAQVVLEANTLQTCLGTQRM